MMTDSGEAPVILFLHIPKTGGTSLDTGFLQSVIPLDERMCETDLFVDRNLTQRHLFHEMELLSKGLKVPYSAVFSHFIQQYLINPYRRYYAGHICYGAHVAIPRPCLYLTLLRDPVDRVVSQYRLYRSLGMFTGTLREYIRSGRLEVDNYQVRCLSLQGWSRDVVTPDMFDEAKEMLLTRTLFSVTERVDILLKKVCQRFGWAMPEETPYLNKTQAGELIHCGGGNRFIDTAELIRPDDLRELADMNQLDRELHAVAKANLERGLRPEPSANGSPEAGPVDPESADLAGALQG